MPSWSSFEFWVCLNDISSMPLLDIATAQASLQNYLGQPRAYSCLNCRVLPCSFTVGDERRWEHSWESFQFPRKVHTHKKSRLIVKAVATLEPKRLAGKVATPTSCQGMLGNDDAENGSVEEALEKMDTKERTRRMRISKANRGLTPWNKGKKHSPETIQRIKERTRLAMQDPKIKMKLAKLGHAQSEETKLKIAESVRSGWQKRREKQLNQETCYCEWQNLIAEASRNGYAGEEELQWNSYQIFYERIIVERVEDVEFKETTRPKGSRGMEFKKTTRPKGSRGMPKSLEQRRKISEAIAAKWADPDYRGQVSSGMVKFHETTKRAPKKPRKKASDSAQTRKKTLKKKINSTARSSSKYDQPIAIQQTKSRRSKGPSYKDPMTTKKLKMIKKIRAQRAAEEINRTEAIKRARSMIAKAEKAANALEIAAATSPIARASLLESRKLIAEAVKSIESCSAWVINSDKNDIGPTLPNGHVSHTADNVEATDHGSPINEVSSLDRTQHAGSTNETNGDFNFSKFAFQDVLNGTRQLPTSPQISTGFVSSPFSLEVLARPQNLNGSRSETSPHANGSHAPHLKEDRRSDPVTTTKKWVRGKLVEVSESS